jgi:hypothetical protein
VASQPCSTCDPRFSRLSWPLQSDGRKPATTDDAHRHTCPEQSQAPKGHQDSAPDQGGRPPRPRVGNWDGGCACGRGGGGPRRGRERGRGGRQ